MKLRFKSHLTVQNGIAAIMIALAAGLLLYKLGALVPGLAASEQQLPSVSESLHTAWNNPLLLPFTLAQLLVALILTTGGYGPTRLPAVLLGTGLLLGMYWLLKQWYGPRLALFGTALLATSPWFLHAARFGDESIVYPLGVTVILLLSALWHKKERSSVLIYVSAIAGALLLYVPGMIWLMLCLVVIERRNIYTSLTTSKLKTALAGLMSLVLLIPLVHRLMTNWHDYTQFLGWQGGWPTPVDYVIHFGRVWQYIFLGGYFNPARNLAGLPLANVLMILTFAIGLTLYAKHRKAARTRLLAALWIVGTILISLKGSIDNSLLLPIFIVLTTGGIGYLLHLWLRVFPRNPLARSFGIGLIALLVMFGVAYNLRNYYTAWPNNSDTKRAFSRQL